MTYVIFGCLQTQAMQKKFHQKKFFYYELFMYFCKRNATAKPKSEQFN